ncbi:MAG: transcriptional regulator [Gammaproteobacteria bacterium CG_4_10_14_0_8_um_filter_38_16]|nr:MAG: transcriptional regulator [Gammaproteobacteria bacterium CG_4_10_14_0_8_um_filter_38_16]PJA04284.1 MAG: transcriptional regulator [Gammaproteobacteria bacterium CG_4_10_14_0_2_um_filter_38_22]PJB11569.1 MAG: transcriptional regulator [Gammaproteobacteria bacterium CG_4_9_14_3_um_filter_38_9]
MTKVDIKKVNAITGDYQEWLISHLKNKKAALAHLQVALEEYQQDGDREAFMLSLRHVAMAQGGVAHLAHETNLNRESLYRLLSGKGNPTIETLTVILRAMGMRIKLAAA